MRSRLAKMVTAPGFSLGLSVGIGPIIALCSLEDAAEVEAPLTFAVDAIRRCVAHPPGA